MLDSGYSKWTADRMWKNGFSLFADGTEQMINRVSFQMSRRKEIMRSTGKYKGEIIHLLYVGSLDFPLVPSPYYYTAIDELDGPFMRMSDARNAALCAPVVP
jgi:hypothetical protein